MPILLVSPLCVPAADGRQPRGCGRLGSRFFLYRLQGEILRSIEREGGRFRSFLLATLKHFDTKELLQSGLDEIRKIIREREPVRPSTRLRQTQRAGRRLAGPPHISDLKSRMDLDLDWIVMRCLEKDRGRRYETANSLAEDIERHLNHEPVIARPPSVRYRLRKSFRRNAIPRPLRQLPVRRGFFKRAHGLGRRNPRGSVAHVQLSRPECCWSETFPRRPSPRHSRSR